MKSLPPKTFADLEWSGVLAHLAERCQTERGADRARALEALTRREDAELRLQWIRECRALLGSAR